MAAGEPRQGVVDVDVAVIGAGPAGLAAATAASDAGAGVALVDAEQQSGGQYWRHRAGADAASVDAEFARLRPVVDRPGVEYLPAHEVWTLVRAEDPAAGWVVHAMHGGQPVVLRARRLVLAPGAYDRQLPFPGWDLPGVLAAGGAQALWKGHRVRPGDRAVVAGTGPFLLPVAASLAEAGTEVAGVYEANRPRRWLRELPAVAGAPAKAGEAVNYAQLLARHRIGVHTGAMVVAAHGDGRLEAVTVADVDAAGHPVMHTQRVVTVDTLAVGWGFTPRLELPLLAGCATTVGADGSLVVVVDDRQRSSVAGVYVAGEACGVGGAALAVTEGAIAGAAAAGGEAIPKRMARQRVLQRRFADAMHRAHPVPAGWSDVLDSDTVVCRCEEVTYGRLREAQRVLGVSGARSAKMLARPGMGWCQGRVCGYAVACLTGSGDPTTGGQDGIAARPIAVPVPLGAIAAGEES